MLGLFRCGLYVLLVYCLLLCRAWCGSGTAGAAVVTDIIGVVDNDGFIYIDIANIAAHIHHCSVVKECAIAPFAAAKSHAAESIAVVHAAIVANLGPPVTLIKLKDTICPTPIARRPKQTRHRWLNPTTRNPVISSSIAPMPVTRRPHIAGLWDNRLVINGQWWRCNRDREEYLPI
jgi:hypothetical protein